ncbi:MAG: hypothetical protein JNK37_05720 [Verrucomicrobiales bacterium]|nr:hypothetical protein [Verrucomicrobiales bacterium]
MNVPDSSHDDLPPDLADLESRLSGLVPTPPAAHAGRRLGRRLDEMAAQRRESRQMWWRFAPVAAAACLTLAGLATLRHHLGTPAATGAVAEAVADEPTATGPVEAPAFVSPPPIQTGIPADHFVPVSSQEILRETTPGGVIELSDRLRAREVRVEYDRAWHWHDPATQTNVRVFTPREEVILVPIETD